MSLVSTGFLVFLLVGVIVYYLIPKKAQWAWLLILSYAYYLCSGYKTIIFMILTTCVTYSAGRLLQYSEEKLDNNLKQEDLSREDKKAFKEKNKAFKKKIVLAALLLVFGILAVIKYYNFAIENINSIIKAFGGNGRISALKLLLPLGISFYSFQSISYVIDVYRGKVKACSNIFKYALFVSYFPQITQGPIGRYDRLAPQFFEEHKYDLVVIQHGLQRMAWGLFKKFIIADRAGVVANLVFNNPGQYHGIYVIIGVLGYCAQLYGDFAGGIDMVMGASEMFGIQLDDNFRQPFFSHSIGEFWRRWHITLGTWMKDYVFYPFSLSKAMNKLGKFFKKHSKTRFGKYMAKALPICLADLLIFFIVGVWHGAAWKYIVYGMYNGIIMSFSSIMAPVYEKMFKITHINKNARWYRAWQIVRTFILVNISWYFDDAATLTDAFRLMGNTFKHAAFSMDAVIKMFGSEVDLIIVLAGCVVWLIISILKEKGIAIRASLDKKPLIIRWAVYILLVMSVATVGYISSTSGGFMYAQF
ncbi:MAG: MBOAT family O-acyltransferase [Eubacteriales bacterium]|nr:MBOAT family O-acyltransferase [Eubacteriales bacterium]